ncbi:MAG TPA: hypothetical protein VKC62_07330, partial [Gaiellaceae bacterium]|nr:hypothetical protein [Gaiellaceae bacterium]
MTTRRLGLTLLAPALALVLGSPLAASVYSDFDPLNDDPAMAPEVPLGVDATVTVQGAVTPGDVDAYAVTLATGDVLSASVIGIGGLPAALDTPYLRLGVLGEAPSASVLVESTDASSDNLTDSAGAGLRFTASNPSIVYVVVTGMADSFYDGSHDEDGPYALVMSRVAARPSPSGDGDPTNDDPPGADPLGLAPGAAVRIHGALRSGLPTDVDFFSVLLAAGDVLVAQTAPLGNLFDIPDTALGIVTADRTSYAWNDDAGSDAPASNEHGSRVRFQAAAPGVYFVAVVYYEDDEFVGFDGANSTEAAGDYVLTVSRVAEDAPVDLDSDPGNDVRSGADALAPGAGGAAVLVGELVSGGPPSDVDYFSVELAVGDVVSATVAAMEPGLDSPDTRLALFDPSGTLVVEDTDASLSETVDPAIRARVQTAGTYTLAVAANDDTTYDGSGTASGRYSLTVGVQPDLPPGPVTLDSDPTNDLQAGADEAPAGLGGTLVRAELVPGF